MLKLIEIKVVLLLIYVKHGAANCSGAESPPCTEDNPTQRYVAVHNAKLTCPAGEFRLCDMETDQCQCIRDHFGQQFGHPCDSTTNKCDSNANLKCSNFGLCECISNPPHIYVPLQEKCFPLKRHGESCEFDAQCDSQSRVTTIGIECPNLPLCPPCPPYTQTCPICPPCHPTSSCSHSPCPACVAPGEICPTCPACLPQPQEQHSYQPQCHSVRGITHMHCDKLSATCQCFNCFHQWQVREMNGSCVLRKKLNDECILSEDCQLWMGKNSACIHRYSFTGDYCGCLDGFTYNPESGQCEDTSKIGLSSKCTTDQQCRASSLGKLSRCSPTTGECECWDERFSDHPDWNAVYFPKTKECFARKTFGSTCNKMNECEASLGKNAICSATKDSKTPVCTCIEGQICSSSAQINSKTLAGLVLYLPAILYVLLS